MTLENREGGSRMLTEMLGRLRPGSRAHDRDMYVQDVSYAKPPESEAPQEDQDPEVSQNGHKAVETLFPVDWSRNAECLGEVVVESKASANQVLWVYKTLKEKLDAEIFYVAPHAQGTSIVCGVREATAFLHSLGQMRGVAAWALTHR